MKRIVSALAFFLCLSTATHAATYSTAYKGGGVYAHPITVAPGTHTFTVTGVPTGGIWPGTPGSYTDWYITDTGTISQERDPSYISNPSYSYGLNAGSYIVRAEIYLGNGTWKEVHRWTVTVQHTVTGPTTPTGSSSGSVGSSISFSTSGSTCNQGHSVQYRFD